MLNVCDLLGFLGRPFARLSPQLRMTWHVARPHLDIGQWLEELDLLDYENCFSDYDGVEVSMLCSIFSVSDFTI